MDEHRTVSVRITGRVQGVSYRAWTQAEARSRDLSGFVRNRADGSVEALFSGRSEAIDQMLASCRIGPPGAAVADVVVREGGEAPEAGGFRILRG